MVKANELQNTIQDVINTNGTSARFRYYSMTDTDSSYDDSYEYAQSGTDVWVSGLQQPIKGARGSSEARLIEQGKLTTEDSRLYVLGTVVTSGAAIKIGLGSPNTKQFSLLGEGIESWPIGSEIVYKKMFIRELPTGSLDKE